MKGKINVKKTTHNMIFVRWDQLENIKANVPELISPPFTLIIDGCPVSFVLSIQCQEAFTIQVHQNSSRVGRAIVFVAVEDKAYKRINTVKTYFIKKWAETCEFNCFGILKDTYQYYSLKIDCRIIWLGSDSDAESSNPPVPASAIATTFPDNKVFSDFTIIVEDQEIPSHKVILARHSSVFSTMFEIPMKELEENKVFIEDIECSTMKILLKIMYTDNAEDLTDVDVILKILHAADKYQISTIKTLCECKLQLLIDENNVLKLLEIGDKYRASELCETCIAYIIAIRNDEISLEFERLSEKMPNIGATAAKVIMDLSFLLPNQHI